MRGKSFSLDLMEKEQVVFLSSKNTTELWHKRMGHFSHAALLLMKKMELVRGLPSLDIFDHQAWAKGEDFRIADTPAFSLPLCVFGVDENANQLCVVPPSNSALCSGGDVVSLKTSGSKWYIGVVANRCSHGNLKLAITVLPVSLDSPADSPSASDRELYATFRNVRILCVLTAPNLDQTDLGDNH
ncbi:GAG-pre-integrase domain [Dillenia turbinata]|uniref:GAG-pre-integrase domain n=1 Tax=Dillenia turbinata TaxID=194707 RepID=A0AAN8VSK0_9MAGN